MKKVANMLLVISIILVSACSTRAWYETVHQNQKLQCQKLPPSEYAECMEQASETYDKYKRKRDEVVNE